MSLVLARDDDLALVHDCTSAVLLRSSFSLVLSRI